MWVQVDCRDWVALHRRDPRTILRKYGKRYLLGRLNISRKGERLDISAGEKSFFRDPCRKGSQEELRDCQQRSQGERTNIRMQSEQGQDGGSRILRRATGGGQVTSYSEYDDEKLTYAFIFQPLLKKILDVKSKILGNVKKILLMLYGR